MSLEREFESRFRCPKCGNTKAQAKKLAMTGTGLSKILDIQMNKYLAVSCLYCGYTEFYRLDVVEGKRGVIGDVLDVIFG
ncbi:zinc ribbon domain-containing protein [Geoglobus ahangari]